VLWLLLAPLILFSGVGFLPLALWFVVALSPLQNYYFTAYAESTLARSNPDGKVEVR
jgi:hypothetical protein